MFRPVSNPAGLVASVLGAAEVQDRMRDGVSYVLAPSYIPPAYAHLEQTQEQHVEAGRLGGSVRKISEAEIARREAAAAKHRGDRDVRALRDAEVRRLNAAGYRIETIAVRLCLRRRRVADIIAAEAHGAAR